MSLRVADRVHIIPMGYEEQRVHQPPINLRADFVVLILHSLEKDEQKIENHLNKVKKKLESNNIDYKIDECHFFDLHNAIGKIGRIIREHLDDEVYVNIATGSKVTAIAGMLACMAIMDDEPVAIPYYVEADKYKEIPIGGENVLELPLFPIEPPSIEQISVLSQLTEGGPSSKKELIEFGDERGLPFVTDHEINAEKGKYRPLDKHIIEPMLAQGFVIEKQRGRKKLIEITDVGEDIEQAFRYLLDE